MPRLTSISIRRFKRLSELQLPLDRLTLLVGANNAGKSSVLQAIHFAVSIAQSARLVGEGVNWQQDSFELSFNPAQLLYSPVSDVLCLATGGGLAESRLTQIEIEFAADDGNRCVVGLRRGRNRNIGVSIVGRAIGETLMDLAHPFTVYAPGLAGVPKEERYMSPGVVRRFVARGDANLTLRNVLRMLKRDEIAWNEFLQNMSSIFKGLTISVDFNEDTDENIEAFFQSGDGPRLPVDAAGTSVLQASQILAYIGLFKPKVLILDEPDSHLHPDNQRALCDLVIRLAEERDFQAIVSTHSRHVLDAAKDRATVFWLSKGHKVDQTDPNSTAMLLDLGALDSVDYFADGHARCVVATEDADTDPIRALLWSNGFREADTEISSYSGCSKVDAALVLGAFLRTKAPHIRLVVHRDSDYLSRDAINTFVARLRQATVGSFVTTPSDVEGYFLNAEHLHELNPQIPVEEIRDLIREAIALARDRSLTAIINCRTQEAFRLRQEGGAPPNHGEIAVRANADLAADPARYTRGKATIGLLIGLMQPRLGGNPRVYFPSAHLRIPELEAAAQEIWAAQ